MEVDSLYFLWRDWTLFGLVAYGIVWCVADIVRKQVERRKDND